MTVTPTIIPGVKIIDPTVHADRRGYFFESYSQHVFDSLVIPGITFVQDNESRSCRGVMRGLHFQLPPHAQAKLVRVVEGAVIDVALDLREDSPAYGSHVAVELSADNHRQLFLPRGIAHGFAVISDHATLIYKVDNFYNGPADAGISILDPSLGISWPFPLDEAILSDKDMNRPLLADFKTPFHFND